MENAVKVIEVDKAIRSKIESLSLFGKYIAHQLDQQVTPLGYVTIYQLAVLDFSRGPDAFKKNRLPSEFEPLLNLNRADYRRLRTEMVQYAEAVFPPDFVADVRREEHKIYGR